MEGRPGSATVAGAVTMEIITTTHDKRDTNTTLPAGVGFDTHVTGSSWRSLIGFIDDPT